MKTALITGVTGQAGTYMSRLLLDKGYRAIGTTRDVRLVKRGDVRDIELISLDLRNLNQTTDLVDELRPDEVFHFASPSSVARSFTDPVDTVSSIAISTLNLLEAIHKIDTRIRFLDASSSEMFGNCDQPADEETRLDPHSPYGVGKSASFLQTKNYREAFDLHACSAIFFNFESPLRSISFVTRKIISSACEIAAGEDVKLSLGNMDIYRDWGWAPEYMEAAWSMLQLDSPADLVVATGQKHSLKEFLQLAFAAVGLNYMEHVTTDSYLLRPFDIRCSVGNPLKAQQSLGWAATRMLPDLINEWVEVERARAAKKRSRGGNLYFLSDAT